MDKNKAYLLKPCIRNMDSQMKNSFQRLQRTLWFDLHVNINQLSLIQYFRMKNACLLILIQIIQLVLITPVMINRFNRSNLLGYIIRQQKTYFLIDFHKFSPLNNLTFLQSNLQVLPFELRSLLRQSALSPHISKAIQQYLSKVEEKNDLLEEIVNKEIEPKILRDSSIQQLCHLFQKTKLAFKEETSRMLSSLSNEKIIQLAFLAMSMNILQVEQWNKLFYLVAERYQSFTLRQKFFLYKIIKEYIGKYFYTTRDNVSKYKFVLRQTHLQDITDFSHFVRSTRQTKLFQESEEDFGLKVKLFINRMGIISKMGKSVNLQNFQLREQFYPIKESILSILDLLDLKELLTIYKFYCKTFYDITQQFDKMQAEIEKRLTQKYKTEEVFDEMSIAQIVGIWKQSGRHNKSMFSKIVKPYLQRKIEQLQKKQGQISKREGQNLLSIALSFIYCELYQSGYTERIAHLLQGRWPHKNKMLLIITDYIKLRNNKLTLKLDKDIINSKGRQMLNQGQKKSRQAMQYNPIEEFWFRLVKRVIPQENIHRNKFLHSYQLDIICQYKEKYFAIQIMGSHYRNSYDKRKKVQKQFMSYYGINMILINCLDIQPKRIMRLRDEKQGGAYLLQRLQDAYAQSCEQKKDNK